MNGVSMASSSAIASRLNRVAKNQIASALDEMLARRVPIQFGGMTDPFSPLEENSGVALELLKVLADFDYPTLISTKGTILETQHYLDVLKRGNFYVRVSFTGAPSGLEKKLEINVPSQLQRLRLIAQLANANIATSGRLQPLILGADEEAARLIRALGQHGARHVSVEFLKWPIESSQHHTILLDRALPGMRQTYDRLNAVRSGREYVLRTESKLPTLLHLRQEAHAAGMIFGFADNDLLHLNPFKACCNASDLFLRGAQFFEANILGAVKRGLHEDEIRLSDVAVDWLPTKSINNYLNSRSRIKLDRGSKEPEWTVYLREKWNGSPTRGGPASFWGCEATDKRDSFGNIVYAPSAQLKSLLLGGVSAKTAVTNSQV